MSKIPQGEWNAIAARYAKGESITRIAQSYGCTPPAIHYILKRNKLRPAANPEHRLNGKPEAPTPFPAGAARPAAELPVEPRQNPDPEVARVSPISSERTRPALPQPPAFRQQPAHNPRPAGRGSAFTAGLDSELHTRAEAAIAAFRSSFDAALAE